MTSTRPAVGAPGRTPTAHSTGRRADHSIAPRTALDEAVADHARALEALEQAVAVVVTTVSTTGVQRVRRAVFMSPQGASRAVDAALARGHRAEAVLVRLTPLGGER